MANREGMEVSALQATQRMRRIDPSQKNRIDKIIGSESKATPTTKARYVQVKSYLDLHHEDGEGSVVGQHIGILNRSVQERSDARKARLKAEKEKTGAIEDILKKDPHWTQRAVDSVSTRLKNIFGITAPDKPIKKVHSEAKKALTDSIETRKTAYLDFAREFGFDKKKRFEDPISYIHSSGKEGYRIINATGETVDLNPTQIAKYEALVSSRKAHEEAKKNFSQLEQEIANGLVNNNPSAEQQKALDKATANLSEAEKQEKESKSNVAAFYDENGILKSPEEYKKPTQNPDPEQNTNEQQTQNPTSPTKASKEDITKFKKYCGTHSETLQNVEVELPDGKKSLIKDIQLEDLTPEQLQKVHEQVQEKVPFFGGLLKGFLQTKKWDSEKGEYTDKNSVGAFFGRGTLVATAIGALGLLWNTLTGANQPQR